MFLAVYCLKKSFLSKVKGMNDRGTKRTFHICARVLPKIEILRYCRNGVHVPHSVRGYLTFKVGKTQFRGLYSGSMLITPKRQSLNGLSDNNGNKNKGIHISLFFGNVTSLWPLIYVLFGLVGKS